MLGAALLILTAAPSERPINVVGHAWAPFISPMGEPFRPRNASDDTLARWFAQADRDHDGQLSREEMQADAARFFVTLDTDGNGLIEPEELVQYEWELAPDIQVSSRLKRQPREPVSAKTDAGTLQGAARYGLLNMPEPVAAADTDFDRAISPAEFNAAALTRFEVLDPDRKGVLTLQALDAIWTGVLASVHQRKHRSDEVDSRVGVPVPIDHGNEK